MDKTMKKGQKIYIGLLVSSSRLRVSKKYFLFNIPNVCLFSFSLNDIKWSKQKIVGFTLKEDNWQIGEFPYPTVVYNRCYSSNKRTIKKLESIIGKGRVFNCITRFDKWDIYNILKNTQFKNLLPQTYLCSSLNLISQLELEKELIVKPCKGHYGKNILFVTLNKDKKFCISTNSIKPIFIFENKVDFINKINQMISGKKYICQKNSAVKPRWLCF
ncbi:hypothetical protein RBH29_15775 [Herbivorax sp. ANBcel31]|nr:YheC/YheD family protein [Herbivorax sp. ANBcel31]MDQ2087890.1 hypothetical protein [Herbivorax sp. ANBcel31]